MQTDFREYTIREAGKSLTAIEIHLKQAEQDSVFCNECTQKHFLEVQKFAEEGAGFFPENRKWWEDFETWARNAARSLTLTKKKQAEFNKIAKEVSKVARRYRKELVVMLEEEIERQAEQEEGLGGQKDYLVGHAGLGGEDEMTEDEAHRFILELAGLDAATLAQSGQHADLGCLLGCGSAELGGSPVNNDVKEATARAKKDGCTCMILGDDPESKICWAKGWIGALSKDQQAQLCTVKNTTEKKAKKTSGIGRVVDRFRKANQRCRENAKVSVRAADPDRTVKVFAHYTGCMTKALSRGGKIPPKAEQVPELKPTEAPMVAPPESGRAGAKQISVKL